MKKKLFTYIFSVICGLLTSGLLIMLFAFIEYALGMKRDMAGGMAFLAFAAGCLVSGLICGLIKHRGGLKIGAVCAAAVLLLTVTVSLISGGFSGGELLMKTVTALVAACTGAVIGVNRKTD